MLVVQMHYLQYFYGVFMREREREMASLNMLLS